MFNDDVRVLCGITEGSSFTRLEMNFMYALCISTTLSFLEYFSPKSVNADGLDN